MTITKNVETVLDESGIELLVGYNYDNSPSFYAEEGNPSTHVDEMVYTELTSVEVVIKGSGIDILSFMNERQKEYIITLLTYEN